ncbi:MAG: alpha/beta hydrolase [Alkalispirochaeta sp.]
MIPAIALILFIASAFIVAGCRTPITVADQREEYPAFARMRDELSPLRVLAGGNDGTTGSKREIPTIRSYYRRTTSGIPGARHEAGVVPYADEATAVHLFFPDDPSGEVVLLVHGYLSHALDHAALIRRLLTERYTVVAPELPGHGLSGGIRGGVESFPAYGRVLAAVIEEVVEHEILPGPTETKWHAVGHSTGAVAIIEYLRQVDDPFRSIVFAAPLVRNRLYNGARAGREVTRFFLDVVPTRYDNPLGVRQMPLSWFDAQVDWNNDVHRIGPYTRPLLVIQGTRDSVVAWRYNREVLQEIFPNIDYRTIRGAPHILYQDPAIRDEAIEMTIGFMRDPKG